MAVKRGSAPLYETKSRAVLPVLAVVSVVKVARESGVKTPPTIHRQTLKVSAEIAEASSWKTYESERVTLMVAPVS